MLQCYNICNYSHTRCRPAALSVRPLRVTALHQQPPSAPAFPPLVDGGPTIADAEGKPIEILSTAHLRRLQLMNPDTLVVVYYHAKWCRRCKYMTPKLPTAWRQLQDKPVVFCKVDIQVMGQAVKLLWQRAGDGSIFLELAISINHSR